MSMASSGVCYAGANVKPCDWSTLTSNVLDTIDRMAKKAQEVCQGINDACQKLQDSIDKYLGWMKWAIPAVRFVNLVLERIQIMSQIINKAIQALNWVIPHLAAPWAIRDIGNKMTGDFVQNFGEFVNAMAPENFVAPITWTDQAGQFYKGKVEQHRRDGADKTQESVQKFGEAVKTLGEDAVDSVVTFISDVTGGLLAVAEAKNALKMVEKAAEAAAKNVTFWLKIITLVVDIIKFAASVASQCHSFISDSINQLTSWPEGATL